MKSIYLVVYDRGHRGSVLELFTSCGSVLPKLSRNVSRQDRIQFVIVQEIISIFLFQSKISFCHSSSLSNKGPQVCHDREMVVSDGCTMCTSKECSKTPLITINDNIITWDNRPTSVQPCCNRDVNP